MKTEAELLQNGSFTGQVEWIGVAPSKGAPLEPQAVIELTANAGIVGEHHYRANSRSKRQVTLIQKEHLAAVAAFLGREEIDPGDLRRNIVVSGINLAALRKQRISIGTALLEGTGDCVPCARMEETLGSGGYAAMVGHGGITCVVVSGGVIRPGDSVELAELDGV